MMRAAILLSLVFPAYRSLAGEPCYFVAPSSPKPATHECEVAV
jgi:hypothetical protein